MRRPSGEQINLSNRLVQFCFASLKKIKKLKNGIAIEHLFKKGLSLKTTRYHQIFPSLLSFPILFTFITIYIQTNLFDLLI